MNLLLTIIAAVLTIFWNGAHAVQPEVGVGISQFNYAHDCSTWYQCGPDTPHTLKLTSPSIEVGLTDAFKVLDQRFRWHGGIEYLGHVSSNAVAHTGPDFDYSYPLAHFNGSGDVWGLYGGVEWLHDWQGITWGFGAGGLVYRPSWHEAITDWSACNGCAITPLSISHHVSWQNTPTLSISATKGGQSLVLTYLHHVTAEGDQWPALYDINRKSKFGEMGMGGMVNVEYRVQLEKRPE